MIANPLSYNRSGTRARVVISLFTLLAVIILIPIDVSYFFWLQPQQMIETLEVLWGKEYTHQTWESYLKDNRFVLDPRYQICQRFFVPGTFDNKMIFYFTMATNLTAVSLVLISYVVIFATILSSRRKFSNQLEGADKKKTRVQNVKIVKAATIMTAVTLLPYLPHLLFTILVKFGLTTKLEDLLGRKYFYGLMDATTWLYFVVPWIFPLLNAFTNPVICKARNSFQLMWVFTSWLFIIWVIKFEIYWKV